MSVLSKVLRLCSSKYVLITKNKLREEINAQVAARTAELTKALDANNYFLRNVSHEIRVPIQIITGISSELLSKWKDLSDKRRSELLTQLDSSSQRLFELVNDVLDLSKFKADKMLFNMQQYDLVKTIKSAIEELMPLTSDQKLKVKLIQNIEDAKAKFDQERIMQVARNIISNAIKYALRNSEIEISIGQKEFPNASGGKIKNLCVAVSNQGQCIPDKELVAIFDPFIQSSTGSSKTKGTGLGLSIAAEIIHSHHGHIWAENNDKNSGVVFYFALPINEAEASSNIAPLCNKDKKLRILCVDDEEGCRLVISMILDSSRYTIDMASNGYEALKYVQENAEKIDLILLDMLLPGMSGLEVLDKLKSNKRYRNIPVLIQSGIDHDTELDKALSIGAVGHISKPYVKEKVLRQIDEVFADA